MRQESVLKKVSWSALIISILTGVFGAALILYPEDVQRLLAVILAAIALGLGIYHLILYFVSQRKNSMLATDLFLGVILILLGAFMYIRRAELLNYITIIFGLILFVDCILEIQNAIFIKRLGYSNWLLILLFGFITLVFAVLMILRPQFVQDALMMISGIFLVVSGVTGIITFIMLRVTMHKAKKALKDVTAAANAVDVDYEEVPEDDGGRYEPYDGRGRGARRRGETKRREDSREVSDAAYTDADFTDVSDSASGGTDFSAAQDLTRPLPGADTSSSVQGPSSRTSSANAGGASSYRADNGNYEHVFDVEDTQVTDNSGRGRRRKNSAE